MKREHKFFIAGIVVALIAPLLIDLVLFGTITPCETIKSYEDGSSVQRCSVKE
jgi:hypothetical protein